MQGVPAPLQNEWGRLGSSPGLPSQFPRVNCFLLTRNRARRPFGVLPRDLCPKAFPLTPAIQRNPAAGCQATKPIQNTLQAIRVGTLKIAEQDSKRLLTQIPPELNTLLSQLGLLPLFSNRPPGLKRSPKNCGGGSSHEENFPETKGS